MVRYLIVLATNAVHFSISTLLVNVIGCFLFGVIVSISDHFQMPDLLKTCLLIGFCGALTTFSTFAYDLIRLLANQQINLAIGYFIGTNILSIIGFGAGFLLPTLFK